MTDESKNAARPTKAARKPSDPRTVFVVSPIGKANTAEHRQARLALDFIIKKAFTLPTWKVIRADDEDSPDSITAQVIERIRNSDLIVADLTGHNPNVFYELAVAHGYHRPVIHMITDGESMPFDINDQRAIFYDLTDPASVDSAITKMRQSQEWLEENPDRSRTPLSIHDRFASISSTSPGSESNEAIARALTEIVHRIGRLENSLERRAPKPVESVIYSDLHNPTKRPLRSFSSKEERVLIDRVMELDSAIDDGPVDDTEGSLDALSRLIREREAIKKRLALGH